MADEVEGSIGRAVGIAGPFVEVRGLADREGLDRAPFLMEVAEARHDDLVGAGGIRHELLGLDPRATDLPRRKARPATAPSPQRTALARSS